ncbi:hypothetical protein M407DRAFT_29311 [Tulasnella calospora MUT 4182]|uniref:Uncharacterized protein n=1 Tax=Tulasnella calospora MUT 4182 TaxID=1051891 RepID=A0A0C3LHY3_9AGAM|nr:hypothetical protein M407DRAFT_29311 [Tulasnella calospora MUT 4182]
MSFVGCVTATSGPSFTANQIRRTSSIGLLGQNTQQQPATATTPSGVQQSPTQLPSKPGSGATTTASGNSKLEFAQSSTTSFGQLQPTAGVQKTTAESGPMPDAVFDNQAILSPKSSIHPTRWPSSSSLQQSSSLSSPNRADDFARRLSLDIPSYPQSTEVAASSQTPPLPSQSTTSYSQISSRPDKLWKHVLESKPKPLQREGSSQSDLSCATTEPASREPSPLLHEGRDPTLPVPVPRMPGLGYTLGRTEVERAPSPPTSPRSHALSMGLKERDFAYEDFPGKAEHQKAMAAMKAVRKGHQQIFIYRFHWHPSIPRDIAMKLSANPHSPPHRARRNSLITAPVPDTTYQLHPILTLPTVLGFPISHTQVQLLGRFELPAILLWYWERPILRTMVSLEITASEFWSLTVTGKAKRCLPPAAR